MRPRSWTAGHWPDRADGRARVLVEESDGAQAWATQQLLERHGYDVAVCEGPMGHGGAPCPLVRTGQCPLAEGADVILNGFSLSNRENREVMKALRRRVPATTTIVEVPLPEARRRADLLEGCRVAAQPLSPQRLLVEVDRALGAP
jgi:hypothetical protein